MSSSQQREAWDSQQAEKKESDERNSKAAAAMFGGIDPSDPAAAEEIAAKLRRQHGWNKVEYKGDGLYQVDFSISSTLTHDFTFPVLEGFMFSNAFVIADLRDGHAVRIEAPGFSAQPSSAAGPGAGMLHMASAFGSGDAQKSEQQLPVLDGSFTITTDGAILANNTDNGPQTIPGGQQLSWTITKRTTAAPMALIQLAD